MSTNPSPEVTPRIRPQTAVDWLIWGCLRNHLLVAFAAILITGWGLSVAPFNWDLDWLPRDPVAVDAIPDIGENQQIVFTEWAGRSPQDIEDQVTYPLTVSLLGVPGVKTIRSVSMFGFSSINIIFEEHIEFYWSRSRILEKLQSLPAGTLPEGVSPALGPDGTAVGQVFWYTLQGRDPEGNPIGGWDPQELRSIQDWQIRYALNSAEGVTEVASIGGFVPEYQIDVDPDAMRAAGVTLEQVFDAVRASNLDVGARTIEINRVEYVIRGLGFIQSIDDILETAVTARDGVPIRIADIGTVSRGPALRRGLLDIAGAEAVGGVVTARYGANPMQVVQNIRAMIQEVSTGLPTRAVIDHGAVDAETVQAFAARQGFEAYDGPDLRHDAWLVWLRATPRGEWPEWVNTSQVSIIPFYDRGGLIQETIGTLEDAITLQILVTIIVVVVMVAHIRSSLLISATLPLAVLIAFIAMRLFDVTANIVALSGIAIAIGTVVDMGVILCENILRKLDEAEPDEPPLETVYHGASEVGGAVFTAIATTIVSFLPVFTMFGPEGKMFRPLAFTKTFALLASVFIALAILPTLASILLAPHRRSETLRTVGWIAAAAAGAWIAWFVHPWLGLAVTLIAVYNCFVPGFSPVKRRIASAAINIGCVLGVGFYLTNEWLPMGPQAGLAANTLFVGALLGSVLLSFWLFLQAYPYLLRACLDYKPLYLALPIVIVVVGLMTWLGASRVFGALPEAVRDSDSFRQVAAAFPGLGREFMPDLDEGSFLYMPSTMPHASIGEVQDVLQKQDRAFAAIPEVESVVGKLGRAESPLDPAPLAMIETVINYKPEFIVDADGRRMRFAVENGEYLRDQNGELIPDPRGLPFRQWRDHIRTPDDIWQEIVAAAEIPGTTSAPKLQPIITRIVMLQTGLRAPMGVKVRGPDLATIERAAFDIERLLREVPGVRADAVFAERAAGRPYLEINIDRERIARHGISIAAVQQVIEVAIGGRTITTTVEGRARYPVRVRYQRELRDDIESLGRILVTANDGAQIPLIQLADIHYVRGPQMIRSEDTMLVGYVTFDKLPDYAEIEVVEACQAYLAEQIATGAWGIPAGVTYAFTGNYENQIRAQRTLSIVLPVSLIIIFVLLYLQFRRTTTTLFVFSAIAVAWGGGFMLLWLYGQPWFLDFDIGTQNLRTLLQVEPVLLSVAIWVGFLALFGIATDDGVVMATYLDQSFARNRPDSIQTVREAVIEAGCRRIRPCLMTSATTILALVPVLTSTGRGADVMVPMAIPTFGGMTVALITLFLVPVLYSLREEWRLRLTGQTIATDQEG